MRWGGGCKGRGAVWTYREQSGGCGLYGEVLDCGYVEKEVVCALQLQFVQSRQLVCCSWSARQDQVSQDATAAPGHCVNATLLVVMLCVLVN